MDPATAMPRKLWEHPNPESTAMYDFMKKAEKVAGRRFDDYYALHKWSCTKRSDFWLFTFDYFPIVYVGQVPSPVVDESAKISQVPQWFKGVKLNFAENILFVGDKNGRPGTSPGKEDSKIACTEVREGSFLEPIRQVSWKELRKRVGRLSQALRAHGVRKGDRVALVGSVCLDTLVVFLAVTTIGGLFSSSSTDMGAKGILERFVQIEPKFVFFDDWAVYNKKRIDLRPKMKEVLPGLSKVKNFEGIVSLSRFSEHTDMSSVPCCQTLQSFLSKAPSSDLVFEQLDFGEPMIVVYSSGTTGQPKCIVHSVGGVVLNGHKESTLQRMVDHNSTQLQFTTTGWIMYMSSVQLMLMGARSIMYDGSPFSPNIENFVKLVSQEKVTHWGVSPRYMQTLQLNNLRPRDMVDLSHLTNVTSTGMVLSDALFEWFYDEGFARHVHLGNISGGTDVAGAFGTANPLLPVYVGGCQCIALAMAVSVYDSTIEGPGAQGVALEDGNPGELVCTEAFTTMPVKLWGDVSGERYFSSYFERFKDIWTHGDFIIIHPVTKQVIFLGRADGVLNPSGVRFGSSDIYTVLDEYFPGVIADSICVGQRRPQDNDESVMLFLLMKPGKRFTPKLVNDVKAAIKKVRSPRHVPKYVFETPEIPCTVNNKKVELPVKQIVSGRIIKPSGTLANPQSLQYYYQFAKDEYLMEQTAARL